jgi:small GTP-binding protein
MIKKMCVIGEPAVGKTSLIRKFVVNKFDDRYISTIGTKTTAKVVEMPSENGTTYLKLQIWDIAGMRSFSKLQKAAYKGANGAFIVLDLTRKETIYTFDSWLLSLYRVAGEIPVVIIGNKNDLKPEITETEFVKLSKSYDFPYYITSAKTGFKVNDAFKSLGHMMLKPWKGANIEAKLDLAKVLEKQQDIFFERGRKLTALEVEDIMLARYCELIGDPDFAMSVIRAQFKKADIDFQHPSADGLSKAADYLLDVASTLVEKSQVEREREVFTNLIKRIG